MMPDRVQWESEAQRLICIDLSLPPDQTLVTMDERVSPIAAALRLAATVSHRVDLLIDLREARMLPGGNWLRATRRLNEQAPDNLGRCVVVGSRVPAVFLRIVDIISRLQPMKADVRFVATMAEARALLDRAQPPCQESASSS